MQRHLYNKPHILDILPKTGHISSKQADIPELRKSWGYNFTSLSQHLTPNVTLCTKYSPEHGGHRLPFPNRILYHYTSKHFIHDADHLALI